MLLDIDHFKDVNDTFGHQAGDHVLRAISSLLRRTVRAYDILICRGGEEFLMICLASNWNKPGSSPNAFAPL